MRTISHTYTPQQIVSESIYNALIYDNSPEYSEYTFPGIWFLLKQNDNVAGFIKLDPLSNVLWQPHIFIFPEYRRNGSEEWGQLVAEFMREHLGAQKFIVFTPYEAAKRYAERMGFSDITVLKNSIRKNGQLLDQYMLEMN